MNKIVGLLLLNCFLLAGCGGSEEDCVGPANGCKSNYTEGHEGFDYDYLAGDGSGDGGGSTGGSTGGSSFSEGAAVTDYDYLDCENLDPDKVYLQASLQALTAYLVILDPYEPSRFCVGFGKTIAQGVILADGRFAYGYLGGTDNAIYSMGNDFLRESSEEGEFYTYPLDVLSNDTLLVDAEGAQACGLKTVLSNPVTGEVFFNCPDEKWFNQLGEELPSAAGFEVISIYPDNGLLVKDVTGLYYISDGGETTLIKAGQGVLAAKHHENGLWIAVAVLEGDFLEIDRWNLSDPGADITLDGRYLSLSEDLIANTAEFKIDGDGYLWHPVSVKSTDQVEGSQGLVRRPIDGGEVELVYTDAGGGVGWQSKQYPIPVMATAALISGM